jgi:gamma-glutamylcyclotransferase (GGCT)/AIG2-like uncharacterized protein YtfP
MWPSDQAIGKGARIMSERSTLLFSYGTLQQEAVQHAQFGRLLDGRADAVIGFARIDQEIADEAVVALSGLRVHPTIVPTGDETDEVPGTVYAISAEELAAADAYEVSDYCRIEVLLKSGAKSWVYVKR